MSGWFWSTVIITFFFDTTSDTPNDVKKELQENQKKIEHLNNDCVLKEVKLVLPSCDNLEKNLHLASNNNSSGNICNMEEAKAKKTDVQKEIEAMETSAENNEKYTTLKEVVDKVILDNALENFEIMLGPNVLDEKESTIVEDYVEEDVVIKPNDCVDDEKNTDEMPTKEEESNSAEETASPSQSDCSRATRWEALADIAAELPPSLAMDPLTGQIYSLAK